MPRPSWPSPAAEPAHEHRLRRPGVTTRLLRRHQAGDGHLPARTRTSSTALHLHLRRRPPGRARRHLRGAGTGEVPGAGATGRGRRRRHGVLALRRQPPVQGRPQRGGRATPRRAQLRTHPLRRDARRGLRHRGPDPRHGPQRRLRVAQLPEQPGRVRRAALPARRERPRAGPGRGARRQPVAPRGVGRAPPRPDHPRPAPLAARPRRGRRPRSGPMPNGASTR